MKYLVLSELVYKKKIKVSSIIRFLLILIMILSGFNYLPQLKINQIPLFQAIIVITIIFSILFAKHNKQPLFKAIQYYQLYIISIIPSLIIGIIFNITGSFLVFFYTIIPYFLFIYTYQQIEKTNYERLLFFLNLSMLMIVIVGWLIRLSFIPLNTFFEVYLPEFNIGYWGISYQVASRNHDYLYPLIGLSISSYFFITSKYKIFSIILILGFIITLIASLSRGAIVIAATSLFLLFQYSSKRRKLFIVFLLFLTIIVNFNFIISKYQDTYKSIITSIFEIKNKESRFSNADRFLIIGDALKSSAINPIGYGINNYKAIYDLKNKNQLYASAENAYLTILVERGWLAFVFFIATFIVLLIFLFQGKTFGLINFLLPFLLIYFLFNYELNNSFACFIFYILFLDTYFIRNTNICNNLN